MSEYCPSEYCQWDGQGEHLCHRCHERPGKEFFYAPTMKAALAGMQMKVSLRKSFGCDECQEAFRELLHTKNKRAI